MKQKKRYSSNTPELAKEIAESKLIRLFIRHAMRKKSENMAVPIKVLEKAKKTAVGEKGRYGMDNV